MAAVANAKNATPGFENKAEVFTVIYDFSEDGGDTGALDLLTAEKPMIIHRTIVNVLTALTSGGSATVALGKSGASTALVDATAGALANLNASTKVIASSSPLKLAADEVVQMTIGTAALTAGKLKIIFECYPA